MPGKFLLKKSKVWQPCHTCLLHSAFAGGGTCCLWFSDLGSMHLMDVKRRLAEPIARITQAAHRPVCVCKSVPRQRAFLFKRGQ